MMQFLKSKFLATIFMTGLLFSLLSFSTVPVEAQETESSLPNNLLSGDDGSFQMMTMQEQQSTQFIVIDAMCPYYLMIGGFLEGMLLPSDSLD